MAIRRFKQYVKDRDRHGSWFLTEQPTSKTLEFANDGFEISINITLSKQEQHWEAIQFLRRVADELSVLERATRARD
ncbi:MAG: hypothetical protein ACK5HO_05955 [Pseudomonadota bacterium]